MIYQSSRVRAAGAKAGAKGFTLVELLVVVGIIALLISILIPTLSRARASAVNVQCMSNLRQIGQAAYIYATEYKGYYPPCKPDSIETLTGGNAPAANPQATFHRVKEQFWRLMKGNTAVFYCPANFLWDWEGDDGPHNPKFFREPFITMGTAQQNGADVKIRYWYMADPWLPPGFQEGDNPPNGYKNWVDVNNNGTTRDEYIKKPSQKGAATIVIATDQSRQTTNNFNNELRFLHPGGGAIVGARRGGSKNNLYGDGHVENKRKDEVADRWGPSNPAQW